MADGLIKKLQGTGKNVWKAIKNTGENIWECRKPIIRGAGLTLLGGALCFLPAKANADTFYISPDNPSINAIIGYECSVKLPTPENHHIFILETGIYDDPTAAIWPTPSPGYDIIEVPQYCDIEGILNLTPDYKLDPKNSSTVVLQAFKCSGNNNISNLARRQIENNAMGVWFAGSNIAVKNVYVNADEGLTSGVRGFYSKENLSNNLIDGCVADDMFIGVNTSDIANTKIRNCVLQYCNEGFRTDGFIDLGEVSTGLDQIKDPGNNLNYKCDNFGVVNTGNPQIPAEGNWWYNENGDLVTNEADILSGIIFANPKPNYNSSGAFSGPGDYIDVWPCKMYDFWNPPTAVSGNVWNMYWNIY